MTVLIDKSENNVEKAKLLLKRGKSYPSIKTTELYNDALLALELAKSIKEVTIQIDVYNLLSGIAFRKDDYQQAIDFDLLALSLSENENHIFGIINAYKNINRSQKALGKLKESVSNAEKAKQIAVVNNLKNEYANINNNLGVAYRNNNQFQKSLLALNEGILQTKNKKLLALLHMNKANTLIELMRLDKL